MGQMIASAAEFIAKPGRTEELRKHSCKTVAPLLRQRSGFIRTIVLNSDDEPRRVVAVTFWSSSEEHTRAPWEESPLVRKLLSPLVDVWPRVRTYKADLSETAETDAGGNDIDCLLTAPALSSAAPSTGLVRII